MKLIWALLFVAYSGVAYSTEQMSFQQELAVERLIAAVESKNYAELVTQTRILEQSGLVLSGDLMYYKALGQFATGEDFNAIVSAEFYLETQGREGKFYREALELKGKAMDNLELAVIKKSRIDYNFTNLWTASIPGAATFGRGSTYIHRDLRESSRFETHVAAGIYNANKDGTVSVYSVIKRGDSELYDLIRVDWMGCPIGTTFNGHDADETCSGKATEFSPNQIAPFLRTFSYAGHSDWRLPSQWIRLYDSITTSGVYADLPGTSFAKDYRSAQGYLYGLVPGVYPQAFMYNRTINLVSQPGEAPTIDTNLPEYIWSYNPLYQHTTSNSPDYVCQSYQLSDRTDSRCGVSGVVVPIRGPFLIESGLSGECGHYSLRVSSHLCKFDSKPGEFFRVVTDTYLQGVSLVSENATASSP
ncbi:hypothetical protein [Methylophaga lonarensis]|uniref:hypothetical protein n=1 Tax=Methylophaga lonarensis TaxID=999151 RepID=UPI003D295CD8